MHLNWVSHENRVPSFTVTCGFFAGALFPCPKWETFGGGSEWEEFRIQSSFLVSTAYPGDCQRPAKSQPQRQRFWCIPTYFCICFTDAFKKTDLYLLRMDLMVVTCCDLFVHVDLNRNLYQIIVLCWSFVCLTVKMITDFHIQDPYAASQQKNVKAWSMRKSADFLLTRDTGFSWSWWTAVDVFRHVPKFSNNTNMQLISYPVNFPQEKKHVFFFVRIFCCFFPENLQKFVPVGGDSDGGKVFGISRGWSCHRWGEEEL